VLFTTPAAVARLWRSFDHSRRITLDVGATEDPNGHPLDFHWSVLQGDPDRIRITPRTEDGSIVDIDISWHDRFVTQADGNMWGSRIDIAAFADNGRAVSAPSVLSVLFPTHQNRIYEPAAGGGMQLREITYVPLSPDDSYADPTLWPVVEWRDRLNYDPNGQVIGIDRLDLATGTELQLQKTISGWSQLNGGVTTPVRHIARPATDRSLALEIR
jgi:hypothetical protein